MITKRSINILCSLLVFSFLCIPSTILAASCPAQLAFVNGVQGGSIDDSAQNKVIGIGDSLTAQYQIELSSKLGSSWEVITAGCGGNTTGQMVARFHSDVLNHKPNYVIIWGGINDIGPGDPSTSPGIVEGNLQGMYTAAHNAGAKVVAINITPFKGNDVVNGVPYTWSPEKQAAADAVNAWIASQASGIDYRVDANSLLQDSQNPNTLLPQYDYGDHLHLNLAGQYLVGDAVYAQATWTTNNSVCYPDVSCQANTCTTTTCTDSKCGWVLNGTKNCGSTPTPNTCGNHIVEAGEECDFNAIAGPYPNQCPNNGPCDSNCKCVVSNPNPTPVPIPTPTPTPNPGIGNPTEYVDLHDSYIRAIDQIDGNGKYTGHDLFAGTRENETKYIPYFRVFIPPGTINIYMLLQGNVYSDGAVTKFNSLPIGEPDPKSWPAGTSENGIRDCSTYTEDGNPFSNLEKMESKECHTRNTGQGNLYAINSNTLEPAKLIQGGWLYVKVSDVNNRGSSPVFYNDFTIEVDVKTYNDWFDHYGSNADGSINWNKDVESVTTYIAPNAPTPINPTPTPTPTPTTTPTCTATFSPASLVAPGTSSISWSSSGADKLLGSCTGPLPISEGNYGLTYSNYPFPFAAAQTGTETCSFTPSKAGVSGTPCSASVIISAPNNPIPVAPSSCTASFSPTSLTAPGTSNLSWSSSGADKLTGSCNGPLSIPSGEYGLSYSNVAFTFTAAQTGTEICSFTPLSGGVAGTACSTSTTVGANNSICECTNGPFSGGSACTGGTCDGCHCVYNGSVVNGACGSSNGQALSSVPAANLCNSGTASAVSGIGPWSWTCAGTGGGTSANCTATKTNNGGNACECTNNSAFGGGDPCTGGICDGCHCNYSACTANCACAANTPVGLTCSNGCGGYCNGTKTGGGGGGGTGGGGIVNPTQYVSLHGDLGRIPADKIDVHGNYIISNIYKSGYVQYFRFFVPTGTTLITSEILEWQGQSVIARHKIIPTSAFGQLSNRTASSLATYESADQYTQGVPAAQSSGRLAILSDGIAAPYLSIDRAGWFYVKVDDFKGSGSYYTTAQITVNAAAYNDWYDHSGSNADGSINWARDVEGVTTYNATPPVDPTCDTKTCIGNSCWNGTDYIVGTKTQGCATGSAAANPFTANVPVTSYLKWNSSGASKMEAACAGPINIARGSWFLNDTDCKNSGLVKECADGGYGMNFNANQIGTEICAFYPTNTSDGKPGTPFTATITSTNGISACGNNSLDSGEDCDGANHPCATGKTCTNCKCVTSNPSDPAIQRVCKPDNANCAKETCNKYYCWDGCAYLKGTGGCN